MDKYNVSQLEDFKPKNVEDFLYSNISNTSR